MDHWRMSADQTDLSVLKTLFSDFPFFLDVAADLWNLVFSHELELLSCCKESMRQEKTFSSIA
jgi:hypothetical protein